MKIFIHYVYSLLNMSRNSGNKVSMSQRLSHSFSNSRTMMRFVSRDGIGVASYGRFISVSKARKYHY